MALKHSPLPKNASEHNASKLGELNLDVSLCLQPCPLPLLRSLSDVQEAAQLLAGLAMPSTVLEALLNGVTTPGNLVGLVNLTPYDSYVEQVCVHWQRDHGRAAMQLRSFSTSDQTDSVMFSERVLAQKLLQDKLDERVLDIITHTQW